MSPTSPSRQSPTPTDFRPRQEPTSRLGHLRESSKTYAEKPLIAVHFEPDTEHFKAPDALSPPECPGGIPNCRYCSPFEEDMAVFELQKEESMPDVLDQLLKTKEVRWAGPIIREETDVSQAIQHGPIAIWTYLTHEMVVVIRPPADEKEVLKRAQALGYRELRKIPYGRSGTTLHLEADKHPGLGILDHAEQLSAMDGVAAEPNLAATSGVDSKGDVGSKSTGPKGRTRGKKKKRPKAQDLSLPEGHWDRQAIGADVAWQELAGAESKDLTTSLKRVEVAVVDGSFYTSPDGAPKDVLGDYELINFRNLRPGDSQGLKTSGTPGPFDKSAPGHGLRAAGVVAANGPGLKGVAPGCRTRLVVFPVTEVDVLDMYVWLAGCDPGSRRPHFPKQRKAVDVVTTSVGFGFARHLPISILADDAFHYIAEHGRGGKGTLLFFSAGNDGGIAWQERPWSTAEANIGVAASTLDPNGRPILASYSNRFGAELCAPSSSVLGKALAEDRRGIKSIGDRIFGGTSSATPLAAGVATLILAAQPELTHRQVRTVLRHSAQKIDGDAEDEALCWRGADRTPTKTQTDQIYSDTYGFGQVHAGHAVEKALSDDPASPDRSSTTMQKSQKLDKPFKAPVASSGGDQVSQSVSLILACYNALFLAMILLWPYDDTKGLAAVVTLLGLYHLVVWAVLRKRRPSGPSNPDERDSITAEPSSQPSTNKSTGSSGSSSP